MTTVIDKHRIRRDHWSFGLCERCGSNPEIVEMRKEEFFSGDPQRSHKAEDGMWVCTKCGYTKKL